MFFDATAVGSMQKNSLCPFTITLTIFKREVRGKSEANRLLGMLSSATIGLSKAQRRELRKNGLKGGGLHDLHAQLDSLFEELVTIQNRGGFRYRLCIDGIYHDVTIKPFLCLIIGDCQGADELCCHYGGSNIQQIHRQCQCPFNSADDPEHECKWVTKALVKRLIETPNNDAVLKAHSLHRVSNAFHEVSFGEMSAEEEERTGEKEDVLTGGIHIASPP